MRKIILVLFTILLLSPSFSIAQQTRMEGVSVLLPDNPTYEQTEKCAIEVRPSYRQIDYQQREMLGFIHIGMNTFTGLEWGTGKESPEIFNPSRLDADKWVKTFKDAGITAVILVCKHHDGFCVWPSKYTNHTVAFSPWRGGKGDLVKDVSVACCKYGLKFCIYLSPWDMHEASYGTNAYNDFYIHLIEELLTNYGPVYLMWFDGAGVNEPVNGKAMPFDWNRIFSRARELQPDVLLSGNAPDVRWVGNEKGFGRSTEWCVQGINNKEPLFGSLSGYNYRIPNLGSIEDLMTKKKLVWYPSRGGLPIRKGWFYNPNDDNTIKSLTYLVDSYFSCVGQNSNLLPNLSPDKTGQIPQKDAQRLIDFGKLITRMKSVDYVKKAHVIPVSGWVGLSPSQSMTDDSITTSWHTPDGVTQAVAEVHLKQPALINVIKLQEDVVHYGQRVESFAIDAKIGGNWVEVAAGTTVGYRRMVRLPKSILSDNFRIRFLKSRISISLGNISMYYLPEIPEEKDGGQVHKSIVDHGISLTCEGFGEHSKIQFLLDKDVKTIFGGIIKSYPASVTVRFSHKQLVSGLSYFPNPEGRDHIDRYAIYSSLDGKEWKPLVSATRFGNIENNPIEQYVPFRSIETRFLKLEIISSTSNIHRVEIADLRIYQ